MTDSIFTKIINGEIHQEIIFEDDQCVVMMTHEPLTPGHCLVIPRQQIDHLWDVDDELYQHLMAVTKRIAHKMKTVYEYTRVGTIVEGFGVPHAHIHVFGLNQGIEPTVQDHAAHKTIASPEQLKAEADKLRA